MFRRHLRVACAAAALLAACALCSAVQLSTRKPLGNEDVDTPAPGSTTPQQPAEPSAFDKAETCGQTAHEAGKMDDALSCWEQAKRLASSDAESVRARFGLALSLEKKGDSAAALPLWRGLFEELQSAQDGPGGVVWRGAALRVASQLRGEGRMQAALDIYLRVLQFPLTKADSVGNTYLVRAYSMALLTLSTLGQNEQMLSLVARHQDALEPYANPDVYKGFTAFYRGLALIDLGRVDQGRSALELALKAYSGKPDADPAGIRFRARLALANVALAGGNAANALAHAQAVVDALGPSPEPELLPTLMRAKLYRAASWQNQLRLADAYEGYNDLISSYARQADDPEPRDILGRAHLGRANLLLLIASHAKAAERANRLADAERGWTRAMAMSKLTPAERGSIWARRARARLLMGQHDNDVTTALTRAICLAETTAVELMNKNSPQDEAWVAAKARQITQAARAQATPFTCAEVRQGAEASQP